MPATFAFNPHHKSYDPSRMLLHRDMPIPQLGRHRNVRVYLPVGYRDGNLRYPVLYMHDGQNVFEPELCLSGASWQAAEQLDALQSAGKANAMIIVAIDCSPQRGHLGRRDEYSPWPISPPPALADWAQASQPQGGEGQAYCDFIVETLKPFIDSRYRTRATREHTYIAGSSMGGFISLYAALRHQDTFSMAGVFSPAFWFAAGPMRAWIEQTPITRPMRIYMDIGTNETSDDAISAFPALYYDLAVDFAELLSSKSNDLRCDFSIDHGAVHSETAWARRFCAMIEKLTLC